MTVSIVVWPNAGSSISAFLSIKQIQNYWTETLTCGQKAELWPFKPVNMEYMLLNSLVLCASVSVCVCHQMTPMTFMDLNEDLTACFTSFVLHFLNSSCISLANWRIWGVLLLDSNCPETLPFYFFSYFFIVYRYLCSSKDPTDFGDPLTFLSSAIFRSKCVQYFGWWPNAKQRSLHCLTLIGKQWFPSHTDTYTHIWVIPLHWLATVLKISNIVSYLLLWGIATCPTFF